MKASLARLYHAGTIDDAYLDAAVTVRGWITQQDADDIRGGWGASEAA